MSAREFVCRLRHLLATTITAADSPTNFSVLLNELNGTAEKIVMVAFNLLYLNGDLRKLPFVERKMHLKQLIAKTGIQCSESFGGDGPEIYKHVCSVGLEGVLSKARGSRYDSGPRNDWMKKTCAQRETLTNVGFALDGNKRDGI
jgi:bifunctional non-homologous end joining protein LigD